MRSAIDFLPSTIRLFMNLVSTRSPNLASGRTSRFSAAWRRDISLFLLLRALGAVFRTALLAVLDALRIEHAAQDMITDARKVLHPATADQDHRVLLKVVALAGNVADHLEAVGQAHLRDLPHGRVRLLRRRGVDARADAPLLRAAFEVKRLRALHFRLPGLPDQLLNRWHSVLNPCALNLVRGRAPSRRCVPHVRETEKPRRSPSIREHAAGLQRIGARTPGS